MNTLKPSHFIAYPWESLSKNCEAEIIARNIMVIMKRRGDEWKLSWEDYKKERLKDGAFTEGEKWHFDKVYPMISDAVGAVTYSKTWADLARKVTTE